MFVNAGGCELDDLGSSMKIDGDSQFEGGDAIRTNLDIADTGNCPSAVYQSARFGNAVYTFRDLPSGNYFVDLHFAEIVYTNGPKGMRVFDVFIQGHKVRAILLSLFLESMIFLKIMFQNIPTLRSRSYPKLTFTRSWEPTNPS